MLQSVVEDSRVLVPELMAHYFDDVTEARGQIGLLKASAFFLYQATKGFGSGGQRYMVDIKGASLHVRDITGDPDAHYRDQITRAIWRLNEAMDKAEGNSNGNTNQM